MSEEKTHKDVKLVYYPDEILSDVAMPVSFTREREFTTNLIERMIFALEKFGGIGIAAPQIGISKRVFLTKLPAEDIEVFINPTIIVLDDEMGFTNEGCLSCPGINVKVKRPVNIRIMYHDENFDQKIRTIHSTDFLRAACIQHEIDHLNGISLPDKVGKFKRVKLVDKIKKERSRRSKSF